MMGLHVNNSQACPHRSWIHGGIQPFYDKMFPRYLG
jgi:hypothetical protein